MLAVSSLRLFLRRFALALAVVGVVTVAGVRVVDALFENRFAKIPVVKIPGLQAQEKGKAANFLLIGSDSRAFVETPQQAQAFGTSKSTPGLSDTMMVVHVEPDTNTGLLVSLPRDLLVHIPGHGVQQLNAAYAIGGQALTVQTIEQSPELGIPIHHYLEVGFVGFQKIVDAIGHVNIWFPTPVRDRYTGLDVAQAGCRALDGTGALAYARSRHYQIFDAKRRRWIETGDDLTRTQRQQYFLRSLGQAAIDKGARNPFTAFHLLDAVVGNLKRDESLSFKQLKALVLTFRGLNPATVQMQTLPVEPAPSDPNRVVVRHPEADPLLNRLRSFGIPNALPQIAAPADVRVRVVNGSGVRGRAKSVLDAFVAHGFVSAGPPADADRNDYPHTQVRFAPGRNAKGLTVAAALGTNNVGEAASVDETLGADVLVVLGRDYDDLQGYLKRPATATPTSARGAKGATTTSSTSTSTTVAPPDTRFVPVDPNGGGPLVGCP